MFYAVTQGVRNSWESHNKSDSTLYPDAFFLGDADKVLCEKLINAGPDHGKFLRQLPIIIDFTGPEYFLKEFDTYKVGTARNSTSMMHTLGREEFQVDMFSGEDLDPLALKDIVLVLNARRSEWIEAKRRKGPEAQAWRAMIQSVPQSWNYRSLWSGNYQVLRNMYFGRRNHRLREWRQFCDMIINDLPYKEFIINA
jgi:hypothetical protein